MRFNGSPRAIDPPWMGNIMRVMAAVEQSHNDA